MTIRYNTPNTRKKIGAALALSLLLNGCANDNVANAGSSSATLADFTGHAPSLNKNIPNFWADSNPKENIPIQAVGTRALPEVLQNDISKAARLLNFPIPVIENAYLLETKTRLPWPLLLASYELLTNNQHIDFNTNDQTIWQLVSLFASDCRKKMETNAIGTGEAVYSVAPSHGIDSDYILNLATEMLKHGGLYRELTYPFAQSSETGIVEVRPGLYAQQEWAIKLDDFLTLAEAHGFTWVGDVSNRITPLPDKPMGVRSSARTSTEQLNLRIRNGCKDPWGAKEAKAGCSPTTAVVGNSNHERALAVDFATKGPFAQFLEFIRKHGAEYDLYAKIPSEPWHWSPTGR